MRFFMTQTRGQRGRTQTVNFYWKTWQTQGDGSLVMYEPTKVFEDFLSTGAKLSIIFTAAELTILEWPRRWVRRCLRRHKVKKIWENSIRKQLTELLLLFLRPCEVVLRGWRGKSKSPFVLVTFAPKVTPRRGYIKGATQGDFDVLKCKLIK